MDADEALKIYTDYRDYWGDIYTKAKDDLRFYAADGSQWSDKAREGREKAGKVCLEINVLPQFVHQVTNQIRQDTPSINIMPADAESSKETAKMIKGLIRKIEYTSGADEAYDTASEYAVICSFGWIRVDHDYVASDSFDQEVNILRVQDPLSVWLDPSSVECDGSDATCAIAIQSITRKEFEKRYGKDKQFISFESDSKLDEKRESITIAEFFMKDYESKSIQMDEEGVLGDYVDDGATNKKTRPLKKTSIKRYMFSGAELLEEAIFPGDYIPIVPVYGQEMWVDGKRQLISLIRNAKDPQRRYNHWASIEAEILSKAPHAPIIAEAGTIEDFAEEWDNNSNADVVRWKNTDLNGNPAAMRPQRLDPVPVPVAIINAMQGAYEDIKRSMGLYDASVGQKSNETSGIALESRQKQGDIATFHFPDNLNRSIAHVGRVVVSMLSTVYDTGRIIQTIDGEDSPQFVGINGAAVEGQTEGHNLTIGKWDVRVTTGPSYTTLQQESNDRLSRLLEAQPQMMGVFGDLWMKDSGIPNAEAIAARIKKTIPPQLTADEDAPEGQQPPDPEKQQMMQTMQQMQEHIQQLEPMVDGKMMEAQAKQAQAQAENDLKMQAMQNDMTVRMRELDIREMELELKREIAAANAQVAGDKLELEQDKAVIEITQSQANAMTAESGEESASADMV